jgi:hypothetical protein
MGGLSSECETACEVCPDYSQCKWGGAEVTCPCDDGYEGDDCHLCEQVVLSDDFSNADLGSALGSDVNGGFSLQYSCSAVASEPVGTNASLNTTASTNCTGGIYSQHTISSTSLTRGLVATYVVSAAPIRDVAMMYFGFQQRAGYSVGGGASRPYVYLTMWEEAGELGLALVAESQAGATVHYFDETFPADLALVEDGFTLEFGVAPDDSWHLRLVGATPDPLEGEGSLGVHSYEQLFNANSFGDVIRPSAWVTGDAGVDTVQSVLVDSISVTTHECGL